MSKSTNFLLLDSLSVCVASRVALISLVMIKCDHIEASASATITSYITHLKSRLFKNVVAQFIGLLCLINQAT